MKKIYLLLFACALLTKYEARSQCTFSSSFYTATINPSGAVVQIGSCSFAGEYSTILGAVNGQTLNFTFQNLSTGAYITIHSGTPSGPIIANGPSPLSFANTFTGTLYAHWSLNAACATDGSCHITTVQCTSCSAPPAPCTNSTSFGAGAINPSGAVTTISTCSYAGEYSTVTGAVNGQTLRFTSSNASDIITIHSGTPAGPVLAFGPTPLVFANTYTGTVYAHWNTPGCGSESLCRTTTVQCTSCVLPPPANDLCAGALTINCGQTITGNTSSATIDAVANCNGVALNTAPGIWYTFTGDGSNVTLSMCGSSFDTEIGVFTGTCGGLVCVTANDDFCGTSSQVTFTSVNGTTYYVLVTGWSTNSGAFTLTRTCIFPCSGVPSPGSISGPPGVVCAGSTVNLTLSGYPNVSGLTFQWKSSATPGGPYINIAGATTPNYSFTASATAYYIVTVTCTNGGGAANTVEFPVRVSNLAHSNLLATPSTTCTPGATLITGTVSGSAAVGNYTHALVGPGVIVQNPPSGTNNANFSFNVSGIAAGVQTYTVTSTDPAGCTKASTITVTVNPTPFVGLTTTPAASPAPCTENFDGVTAPALPANWLASFGLTCVSSVRWATVNAGADSPPNAAFTNDPPCVSDEYLDSRSYVINSSTAQLTFRRSNTLESGFDGMVLEMSTNGGPFVDIITAGGTFVAGAYNGPISSSFSSPIAGRQAWTGSSGGYVTTTVNLPAAANGQNVKFRWRRATDVSVSSTGVFIDGIVLTGSSSCGNLVICNGQIVKIDAIVSPGTPTNYVQLVNTHIPAGGNTSGNASPYPNTLTLSGLPPFGVSVKSVTLTGYSHSFPDDVDVVLVSPSGQSVILMSDAGGGTDATGQNFVFDDAGPLMSDGGFNASGTYKPTNFEVGTDNWPSPGPGTSPVSTTLSTFSGNMNGDWKLYIVDDATGDIGFLATWTLTLNVPAPVVFSPVTNLWLDAGATTTPYTGTSVYTVYSKPPATITYTASTTLAGCPGSSQVTITVNQPPAITTQPVSLAQPVCPGFNAVYTVVATGPGLTYQWQISTNGGTNWSDITNPGGYPGFNTNTLTVWLPNATMNGHMFRVIVSGTCAPPATSNAVTLVVATPPTITSVTTNPAIPNTCIGGNITFTVAFAGVPTPNIFQWQVSTDNGLNWTNLTTGGAFTPTFTITGLTAAMNGFRYRVIVTNYCGQSATSASTTLTVSAVPVATATALTNRICLSDSLVPLVGSPVGGSWSGIGVSGFNFVPAATGVGTFTLTYTFTNAGGCSATATVIAKVEDCPERIRLLRDDAVIVYPNPNNGRFNVRINSTLYNYLGMKVFNTAGQLIRTQNFGGLIYNRVINIDLHTLPGGTYMVKFYYDDGIRTSEKTFPVVISH